MYQHQENSEQTAFMERWRNGDLAKQTTASTISLSLILVFTLLVAQSIVASRTYDDTAIHNARSLIQEIKSNGLDYYFGLHPSVEYFVIEENSKPVGFLLKSTEPEISQETGETLFNGKEIVYYQQNNIIQKYQFQINNDMSHYYLNYSLKNNATKRSLQVNQYFKEGLLFGQYRSQRNQTINLRGSVADTSTLAPPFMIDFISSVAGEKDFKDGALFYLPSPDPIIDYKAFLEENYFIKNTDTTPDQAPSNIARTMHAERRILSIWKNRGIGNYTQVDQYLCYNTSHQLIWQSSIIEDSPDNIVRSISRQEILNLFPEAQQLIDLWLRVENIKNDEII